MTIQNFPNGAGVFWPRMPLADSVINITATAHTIDADGEKVGWVFQATKSGAISGIEFLAKAVTASGDIDFRVETVSLVTSAPSGTLWATNTNKIQDVPSAGWQAATLTANATVSRGDMVAIVIEANSTNTPDLTVGGLDVSHEDNRTQPYCQTYVSSWSGITREGILAVKMSDGSFMYIPWFPPVVSYTSLTVEQDTDPDEVGIKFQIPFPADISGMWIYNIKIASGNVIFKLYDSDGSSVLSTITIDEDSLLNNRSMRIYWLDADIALSKDTWYRLTFQPDGTTGGGNTFTYYTVNAAANLDGVEGGQKIIMTERTDGGAWTDTDTRRPFMGIVLNGFDDGTGGGGGNQGISQGLHTIGSQVSA